MQRFHLLEKIRTYSPADAHEKQSRLRILEFMERYKNCFDRSLLVGHITGSAFIVNANRTKTLLTHHHKLNKWLQLGGHSDGDPNTLNVALREAEEESGLRKIIPVSVEIFDVDVHEIPARKDEPAHFHYDVRFLFEADEHEQLTMSSESKNLAWIPLKKIEEFTTEESVLRMVRKLSAMK